MMKYQKMNSLVVHKLLWNLLEVLKYMNHGRVMALGSMKHMRLQIIMDPKVFMRSQIHRNQKHMKYPSRSSPGRRRMKYLIKNQVNTVGIVVYKGITAWPRYSPSTNGLMQAQWYAHIVLLIDDQKIGGLVV